MTILRNLTAAAVFAAIALAAELPVRSVVLYKHGVGYFQRSGPLAAGESARLDFKEEEMNDVLKSLTVNDSGGKVSGVRYDSNVPLDQKLGEFPFHIGAGQPLSAVLDQLKGARIEMDFGSVKTAGAIVSARLLSGDKDRAEHEQLTLLLDSGELRNVDLSAASAIRFTDRKLQLQFADYLAALTGSRSKDKRSVYIDSTDSKSRDVRATYIMPMPAWKSSYRLLFDEKGVEPTLEGWAIVDNTTGEDWTGVKIALVSGKPISFISELYDPKYITRLTAELPEDKAVAPTVYNGALSEAQQPAPAAPAPAPTQRFMRADGDSLNRLQQMAKLSSPSMDRARPPMSTVAVTGPAREIADLFEYDIPTRVTIRKNESSMLPFLQQKIAARKLIIYSDSSTTNPLTAAELTNNTGRTLDGGPITVYDAGTYAGEALVETVKNGDKRFIGYGVDLGTRITTNLDSESDNVRELHAAKGILTSRSAMVEKKSYTIRNVDPRAKTLIVEHPLRAGYKLIDTAKPVETTQSVYRFEVKLAASASATFPVTEENVYEQQISVSSLNPDALLIYIRNKNLSDAGRRQLQQIADLKTKIAAGDAEKRRLETTVTAVTSDEQRNRQNIASLSNVAGQQQIVQDYARKLSDQETQIAGLRAQQSRLDSERAALQSQLEAAIDKLQF